VDLFRGRGRPVVETTEGANVVASWPHPGTAGDWQGLRPGVDGRSPRGPSRATLAPVLPDVCLPWPQERAQGPTRARLHAAVVRGPRSAARADHIDLGQSEPPRKRDDARLRRATRLADRGPAARLRPGAEPDRGRLVAHQARNREPGPLH